MCWQSGVEHLCIVDKLKTRTTSTTYNTFASIMTGAMLTV